MKHKIKKKKKTNILSWCICERWRSTWNALSDGVSGEEWRVYTLKKTIKNTETFYNRAHRPRREMVHTTDRKKTSDATREGEFNIMYKIHCDLRTHLEEKKKTKEIQKKTIQTIYASCYTERHSVWYVIDYCRRIFTHNCYKVERKGSALSSNGNSFLHSWRFMCWKRLVLMFWGEKNTKIIHCCLKWGITEALFVLKPKHGLLALGEELCRLESTGKIFSILKPDKL